MKLTIEKSFISYELASALVQNAINHAKTLHLTICVAIVDTVGNLVCFSKMDDCNLIGIVSFSQDDVTEGSYLIALVPSSSD
ncbi:MAG: heme-binding protein [Legionellaceae bacterium]|nr:heme-binding protein [Legionellaceae bacterium]